MKIICPLVASTFLILNLKQTKMKRNILRRIVAGIYHKSQDYKLLLKKKKLRDNPQFINVGGGGNL